MQKTAPLRRGCFLSRAPAHPAARHTRASRRPPYPCVPLPAMPVRPAARHACASRNPSYRCTSPPALLARPAAASRFIPPASVSAQPAVRCACTPHQPPCRFIPPASAPVRPADRRAGVFRRRQAGLYRSKAALPIPFRSKGYPFHIYSATRIAAPYSVLRQGTPLRIASPPQRTPAAPPFALRQESLRSILSNKERRSQTGPARRAGKRGRTSRPVPPPLVPPERAKPACPRRRAFCRRTACKTSIHTTTPYTHLNTPSSLHAAARDAPYSTPPQETLISILFCGKRHRSYFLLQL